MFNLEQRGGYPRFPASKETNSFDIDLCWSWDIPRQLTGTVVVADAYAATSNIATMLASRVKQLYLVNGFTVRPTKDKFKKALIVGEGAGFPTDFFHSSNYPSHLNPENMTRRTVLFMSANGTRVIQSALNRGVNEVLTVSFNNFSSVKKAIEARQNNHPFTFIASGDNTHDDWKAYEDMACLRALRDAICGKEVDLNRVRDEVKTRMRSYYSAPSLRQDMELVTRLDCYNVVPVCRQEKGGLIKVTDLQRETAASHLLRWVLQKLNP